MFALSFYLPARNYRNWLALCAFLILATRFHVSNAQVDTRWIAGDGNWSEIENWDNGVPIGNFNAIIDFTAGVVSQDVGSLELDSVELNGPNAKLVLDNSLIAENLNWQAGQIEGSEEIVVNNGQVVGEVILDSTFNNTGFIQLGAGGQLAQVASSSIAIWNNRPGSLLEMNSGSRFGRFVDNGLGLLNIESNSMVLLNDTNTEINWDFVNEGIIQINDSNALFLKNYEQTKTGHLILNDGHVNFTTGSAIQGKVSGVGSIILGGVEFDAVLEPGGSEIGSIQFAGSLPMTPTTVSNFQIGPGLSSDAVSNIGGGLQLDGTLNIEALPGATTGVYTLFTYNNGFNLEIEIQLGVVPTGFKGSLFLDVPNKSIKLDVQAIEPVIFLGDVNQDGVVDLLDVAGFVALLSNGQFQAEADVNQDGSVDLLDVSGFVLLLTA